MSLAELMTPGNTTIQCLSQLHIHSCHINHADWGLQGKEQHWNISFPLKSLSDFGGCNEPRAGATGNVSEHRRPR